MQEIHHALVLNLHQPSGNLDHLLAMNEWECKEILFAYDRMPRSLWSYEDIARVNLTLSGTLLESLADPGFQSRTYGIVDCGTLLWSLQNERIFEIIGTGYYHPVLALIPEADWDDHIERWLGLARHVFWRDAFAGFWPPEMGFTMEVIPHLVRAGYRYVLVDSEYVDPVDQMSWQELRYRPHIAEYDGHEIVIVVRDRDLSNAQLAGMDYGWFYHELNERTKWCEFPPLVTTATDGDNGGWFRNTNAKANFWQYFYKEALDHIRNGWSVMRPTKISDYLDRFGAHGRVTVRRGAWNTDEHHGWDFHQWQGGEMQRDAMARIHDTSRTFRALLDRALDAGDLEQRAWNHLDHARWRLLRAETSCNLYWGDAWVHKTHHDLDACWTEIHEAERLVPHAAVAMDQMDSGSEGAAPAAESEPQP